MIDFEWYRSFVAVYRSGTVTEAAKVRHLTQPAISQHILGLESVIGHDLFVRTPRKMRPTEQGKALYTRIISSMDGLEKTTVHLKDDITAENPVIRLGTPLAYFYEVGLEKLREADFRLRVEIGSIDKLIEQLSAGKLDVVIATQRIGISSLDYKKLFEEEFCLIAPMNIEWPEELKKQPQELGKIEDFLLSQKWISFSAELPIIRRFWHVAFGCRPEIEPVLVVPGLLPIRKAVELGMGVSVLPRYVCQSLLERKRLKVLWEPEITSSNDLWIATRKVDRNKREIEQFISLLEEPLIDVST